MASGCHLKPSLTAVCLLYLATSLSSLADGAGAAPLVLTNAAQVRALSSAAAAGHLPVSLRGVVLLRLSSRSLILLDESAGIFLEETNGILSSFRGGDTLAVEGVVDPGDFAPFVKVSRVTKTGTGPLPKPQTVTFDELATGRFDAQYVEISGVVRRTGPLTPPASRWNPLNWELRLATGGGQLSVRLSTAQGESLAVDTEIRLRGVCLYQFTKARQVVNPVLSVPDQLPVSVLRAPPQDPFAVAVRPVDSLMQFNAEDLFIHRVRVRGVVTHAQPGEGFWIQEAGHGLQVLSRQAEALAVGDQMDVLGFLGRGKYAPLLEDAVFRKLATNQPVAALKVAQPQQALGQNANLIELEGKILEVWQTQQGCQLALINGPIRFLAFLQLPGDLAIPKSWQPNSWVRIKGICSVNAGTEFSSAMGPVEPKSFQILLRSPDDLTVLQPPPWWTVRRVIWVLGIMVGLLLLVVAVIVWSNQRRLREQARARMRSEAEFAAILSERNRMAREIHDTLAQDLAAVSAQLESLRAKLPPGVEWVNAQIMQVREIVRSSLAEARRSIFNMRSQVLEQGDLAHAFRGLLDQETKDRPIKGTVSVTGAARRLSPAMENDLLRSGQEAIHNAIRHGQPRNLNVFLRFTPASVSLRVQDDGLGFDPRNLRAAGETHFGLLGVEERARRHGAAFKIDSAPGRGTEISLEIPLE
jgi:signal transduction histidine kinase